MKKKLLREWKKVYEEDLGYIIFVRNHRFGLAVSQPVFDGLRTKKGEQLHGNGAQLINRYVRNQGFRTLGKQNSDSVGSFDVMGL